MNDSDRMYVSSVVVERVCVVVVAKSGGRFRCRREMESINRSIESNAQWSWVVTSMTTVDSPGWAEVTVRRTGQLELHAFSLGGLQGGGRWRALGLGGWGGCRRILSTHCGHEDMSEHNHALGATCKCVGQGDCVRAYNPPALLCPSCWLTTMHYNAPQWLNSHCHH